MPAHSGLTGASLHVSKIESGAGAPGSTPSFVGQTYFDTTNHTFYVAEGVSSSADWKAGVVRVGTDTLTITTSGATSVTFPTSGTMATLAGTEALTNKTINGSSNTITNVSLTTAVTGTLPIANGGTGQTAQTAAFDALAPSTTKGDVIVHDGTDNIRVAVGADGTVLTASSGAAAGVAWGSVLTNPMDSEGDLIIGGASGVATKLDRGGNNTVVRSNGTTTVFGQIDAPGFFTTGAAASNTDIGIVTTGTQTMSGAKTFNDTATGTTISKFTSSSGAASATEYGVVSTGTQTFAGSKTLSDTGTGTIISKFGTGSALATASAIGLVSTGSQTFAGLKTFQDKFLGHPSITIDTAASGAVTLSTYYTYFTSTNITSSRNVKFPNTAKAGEVWWIFASENAYTGAQLLPVAQDDTNIGSATGDDNITNGYIALQALIDSPATNSDWRVVTISDARKITPIALTFSTTTTAADGNSAGNTTLWVSKVDNQVSMTMDNGSGTGTAGMKWIISAANAIPLGFAPTNGNTAATLGTTRQNGTTLPAPGKMNILGGASGARITFAGTLDEAAVFTAGTCSWLGQIAISYSRVTA